LKYTFGYLNIEVLAMIASKSSIFTTKFQQMCLNTNRFPPCEDWVTDQSLLNFALHSLSKYITNVQILHLDGLQKFNNETLCAIGDNCKQLTEIKLRSLHNETNINEGLLSIFHISNIRYIVTHTF
jgi:hypothetical protein